MNSIKKQFGARLKELREQKGYSQEQLAELLQMESRHISRIETGKSFTTLENIDRIAKVFEIDINEFFSFSHKHSRSELIKEINNYLENAKQNELELCYRLIKILFT